MRGIRKLNLRRLLFWKKTSQTAGGSDQNRLDRDEIQKKLNGTTLMVYFAILNKKIVGVRELQRNLELSSPSVARYHLDKLCDLCLVQNNNGEYHLINKADIPVLSTWVLLGKWLLPRALFMAIFFSVVFIGYMAVIFVTWNRDSAMLIFTNIGVLGYLWFDVLYEFKNRPI